MTNEVGRSMVETLGMLAIMGVLSVVGLAAYNSAMDKSRANTLIQEAQKRAVIVAGQIGFNNQTPSLAEFVPYNITSAGTFGNVVTTGLTGQFGIQVSNVSKSICQNILNVIGDTTPIRRLSKETTPTTPITSCDEDNTFLFIYNNDMTGENDTQYCESDENCSACGKCSTTTHLCEDDCVPPENECDEDADCNSENECMVCDTEINKCKNGCERVGYLKSDGSVLMYIDPNLNYFPDFEVGVKCDSDSDRNATLGIDGNNMFERYSSSQPYWTLHASGTTFRSNVGVGTYADAKYKDGVFSVNGNVIGAKDNTFPSGTFYLFRISSSNIYKMSVYFFKAWNNNGKPVRDFVPVIAPDGKACMLNRVKEDGKLKLYCDANGGTFKTNKDN